MGKVAITKCTKADAKTLIRFGHRVYAEIDSDLKPHSFFIMDSMAPPPPQIIARSPGPHKRAPMRNPIVRTAFLKLSGNTPRFASRGTHEEAVYIMARDLLAQKKYGGRIQRGKLEEYLVKALKKPRTSISPTVANLIHKRNAFEEAK